MTAILGRSGTQRTRNLKHHEVCQSSLIIIVVCLVQNFPECRTLIVKPHMFGVTTQSNDTLFSLWIMFFSRLGKFFQKFLPRYSYKKGCTVISPISTTFHLLKSDVTVSLITNEFQFSFFPCWSCSFYCLFIFPARYYFHLMSPLVNASPER